MDDNKQAGRLYNVLVTGGSGFLGERVVMELLENDSPVIVNKITVLDIREPEELVSDKVIYLKGDIRDYDVVHEACHGIDIVFHVAAIVDWGVRSEKEVLDVNVKGTENIVQACLANNVKALVFTSSLDAVYNGKPLINIDEDHAYPEKHKTTYCKSKYLAEEAVTKAVNNGLNACTLRPSDIYGEKDPYHIGSLIDMARGGFYIRLGNGKSHCQHVYVANMAFALIQAAHKLIIDPERIMGKKYFITDGEGSNFFRFFDQIIIGAGYKIWPKNLWLPRGLAYSLASVSEFIALLARPIRKYAPKFSRFAVTYTCTDFTFNAQRAKDDFGFYSKYSHEEALGRTIAFYRDERLRQMNK